MHFILKEKKCCFLKKPNPMKVKLIALSLLVIMTYSCKKDNEDPKGNLPSILPTNSFYPMSVGNYWVFEFTNKDPNGDPVGIPSIDTLKIVKDTLINELSYFLFETNKPSPSTHFLRRDSSGYIISPNGTVVLLPSANEGLYNFHYGIFNSNDTAYAYWEEYIDGFTVNTDFGNFESLGKLGKHEATPNWGGNTSIDTNLYAEIGSLQRSFSYLSGGKMIGVLIDYHLEE